ncbi:MAG: methyltransferase domain-containing protein [Terriglobales bacterium]
MTHGALATSGYIMEDPREAARLELKVDSRAWVQKYLAPRIHAGAAVLSVGCGPGAILGALAALDSSVRATGIDISPDRVEEAKRRHRGNPRLAFVCGDAQAMQFPSDSFDLVYSRMLLEYLQAKEQAVAEMVRVCKPGGRVLLQDLDGQLLWHYPEDAAVQRTVERILAGLAPGGFDSFVGRKLFWLAQRAGLKNLAVQVEGYHVIAGAITPTALEQWELKLAIARPQLARFLGGDETAQAATRQFLEYLRRPDTLTYSVQFTVTGEKPS